MSNLLEKFKCPQCKTIGKIELIETNCNISAQIKEIWDESTELNPGPAYNIEYYDYDIISGETDRYQCDNCGYIIEKITSEEELIQYLIEL